MQNSTYKQKRIVYASIKTPQIELLPSSAATWSIEYWNLVYQDWGPPAPLNPRVNKNLNLFGKNIQPKTKKQIKYFRLL